MSGWGRPPAWSGAPVPARGAGRPNAIDIRALGMAMGRQQALQHGLGLAIQLAHGSPDYYASNLARKEHLEDRAHAEKLGFERIGAQFSARERLAQEQAAEREKAHKESLASVEGRARASLDETKAQHKAMLKQHGEDADRRVTAAETKAKADAAKRDDADRRHYSDFYQRPAGQDVLRERLKTAAGEVPFLGPSLSAIAQSEPGLKTARDREDDATARGERHKATAEAFRKTAEDAAADRDNYRKQRDIEMAAEREKNRAAVAAAHREGRVDGARRAAEAAVEASPFFLKATPEQKKAEIERRVKEATEPGAPTAAEPAAPEPPPAPEPGPAAMLAPAAQSKAGLFEGDDIADGPGLEDLDGPIGGRVKAKLRPGGRQPSESRADLFQPGRLAASAPLLDWGGDPTGTNADTPEEAAARGVAAHAQDATFPPNPPTQAPAEHLAALQEAVRRLHAQNAPPPSEAQGVAKAADQPTAPAVDPEDAPPPPFDPPYIEDAETGREVNAYNVRNPHEVMVDILERKHPVARKYAIDELKADPEESARRGVDLDDLAKRFPEES